MNGWIVYRQPMEKEVTNERYDREDAPPVSLS